MQNMCKSKLKLHGSHKTFLSKRIKVARFHSYEYMMTHGIFFSQRKPYKAMSRSATVLHCYMFHCMQTLSYPFFNSRFEDRLFLDKECRLISSRYSYKSFLIWTPITEQCAPWPVGQSVPFEPHVPYKTTTMHRYCSH